MPSTNIELEINQQCVCVDGHVEETQTIDFSSFFKNIVINAINEFNYSSWTRAELIKESSLSSKKSSFT